MSGMTLATRAGLIKFAILSGAGDSSTAGIACAAGDGTAITVNDRLVGVVELHGTTYLPTLRTASSAIIAGGKVTCPNSAGKVILVWWMARDAERQCSSPFVQGAVGAGAGANTAITVSGISTTDRLICVAEINASTGAWTDRTAASSITAANEIKCTSSTAGNSVFVMWMDLSGPRAFSALNLQLLLGTLDASPTSVPSSATVTGILTTDKPLVVLAVDETDADALAEFGSVSSVTATDTVAINDDSPSPTLTAGATLYVFYQKGND